MCGTLCTNWKMILWLLSYLLIVPRIENYAKVSEYYGTRSSIDVRLDGLVLEVGDRPGGQLFTSLSVCCPSTSDNGNCSHQCHWILGLCLTEYRAANWTKETEQLAPPHTNEPHEVELPVLPTVCPRGKDQLSENLHAINSTHFALATGQIYRFHLGALPESGVSLAITIYYRRENADLTVLQRFEGRLQLVHPDNIWSALFLRPVTEKHANETILIRQANDTTDVNVTTGAVQRSAQVAYKYACRQHYYGPICSHYCAPRHSVLGHYRCHPLTGALICDPGWSGTRCNQAICRRGCVHGICEQPDRCQCLDGWTGPKCDQCVPIPGCVNGRCHFNSASADWEPYTCECATGWDGMLCNINKNACSTMGDPCQNGGRCLSTPDIHGERPLYTCLCPAGFQGTHCERKIVDCRYHGCGAQGKCEADGNCTCASGYYGSECQFHQADCSESPCLGNQSTCRMMLPQPNSLVLEYPNRRSNQPPYECHCEVGRYGTNCELELDRCATTDPCLNGGRCVNVQNGYLCVCPPNFTGTRCEQAQVACRHDSCANGGECLDLRSRFVCHCPLGWTGLTCRENVNECAEIPRLTGRALCAQGAGCRDLLGSYQCLCPPGWGGRHCELPDHVIHPSNESLSQNISDFTETPAQLDNGTHSDAMRTSDMPPKRNSSQQSMQHVIILFAILGIAVPLTLIALVAGLLLVIANCQSYNKDRWKKHWPQYRSSVNNVSNDDQALTRTSINRYTLDTEPGPSLLPDCLKDRPYPYCSLLTKHPDPHAKHIGSPLWFEPQTKCTNHLATCPGVRASEEVSHNPLLTGIGTKKKTKRKASFDQSLTRETISVNSLDLEQSRFPHQCVRPHRVAYSSAIGHLSYIDPAVINALTLFSPSSTRAYSPPPPYEEHSTASVSFEQEQ